MFKKIKNILVKYVLKEELERIEKTQKHLNGLVFESRRKATAQDDHTQLMRQNLKGIDPKSLNAGLYEDEPYILDQFASEEEQLAFLKKVRDLKNNEALPKVLDYLVRVQILHSVKNARSLEEFNFGRATVNGLSLFREEIDNLNAIFLERTKPQEDFDKHSVL